jgi:hypothetical protein
MDKLDRLGWAAGLVFVCHGARLGIRSTDPGVLGRIGRHLPPGWRPAVSPVVDGLYSLVVGGDGASSRVRRYHLLYVNAARLARTLELEVALEALESDLHFQVALTARRRLFVHAGVVAWRGRAIVIPGESGSGKSSLVAALVRAGAAYYSDEYAVLDGCGRVHPYARPLALRPEGVSDRPSIKVMPEELGGRAGTRPLPVALVVATAYRAGSRWRPRVLSPAEGVLALLEHTVLARARPELALGTLHHVVATATTLRGVRGEAEDTVRLLLDRMSATAEPAAPAAGRR